MIPIEIPKPIEDLSTRNLNGYKRNRIVVSNDPDPRIGDFDFESTVFRNWPSQQYVWNVRGKYRQGYIHFNNGRIFEHAGQTIQGVPKFLFDYEAVKIHWELYLERKKLREALNALKDEDFFAAAELLIQLVAPNVKAPVRSRSGVEGVVARRLPGLGLSQLRALSALLMMVIPHPKEWMRAA